MNAAQQKQALREQLRAINRAISAKEREDASAVICERLLRLTRETDARTVFCFVGTEREIDTRAYLAAVLADGRRLLVPRCVRLGEMELRRIGGLDELQRGMYGIWEPTEDAALAAASEVELAVIPCLGCTRDGRRLGKGGGFYDRFLGEYGGDAVMVCMERMICAAVPMEGHDERVGRVITEA